MVSVTGLKSAIYFLNSHGTNNQTPRKGKNLKKKGPRYGVWLEFYVFFERDKERERERERIVRLICYTVL